MKTALALRHLHFEDLGTLEPLLRERGYDVRYLDPAMDTLAAVDAASVDLMVVLGGPLGAFDEAAYPFLAAELNLIERRLASGRPLIGICLGAQLIARLLGAQVAPMEYKEIGFSELTLTPAGNDSALAALAGVPVLHWHGDRYTLPANATLLASTEHCDQQAYAVGSAVLGLQFHLEADAGRIEQWLVGHCCELGQTGIDPRIIREDARRYGAALTEAARAVVGHWLDSHEA